MDLTQWFPVSETIPERVGVYEISDFSRTRLPFPWHFWNGERWGPPAESPAVAEERGKAADSDKETPHEFYLTDAVWRGLK